MKDSKYYKKLKLRQKNDNKTWLTKILLTIIMVLISLIACNFNTEFKDKFVNQVLEKNMNFNKFNKLYKKIMLDEQDTQLVNNSYINPENSTFIKKDGRYKINNGVDSIVEVLKPGIIVFNGKKEELGNTVIIQGNDGVDIWYSNVVLKEYSLYDYVSAGDILGITNDVYLTISIYKDGKLLDYEEYIG